MSMLLSRMKRKKFYWIKITADESSSVVCSNPVLKQGFNFEAFIGRLLSEDQSFVSFFASTFPEHYFPMRWNWLHEKSPLKVFARTFLMAFSKVRFTCLTLGRMVRSTDAKVDEGPTFHLGDCAWPLVERPSGLLLDHSHC